ncbi:hypothetical protein [Sporichthya polymorpha]|uniref:hypothetical protein n=1 Tax=Sporichthya polymorpha TaxID=35751 RepID=UPI0003637D99|nr:hypothetical protein [Sporichthya polymorpha]
MDQATELRRAYATLGISENATLEEARAAYSTWSMLLSDLAVVGDSSGEAEAESAARSPEQSHAQAHVQATFARHELDLAWYAIEQAHIDGALFVRRARGCSECGRTPAVRITLHTVESGCFRARRTTTSSLVCRDCGLQAVSDAQRTNRRDGWWNTLGPIWTVQAITRNAGERRFLRRVDAPPRRPAPAPRVSEEDLYAPRPRRRSVRILGWITGLAAIGLTVGMAVPVATGDHEPPPPATSTADPAAK